MLSNTVTDMLLLDPALLAAGTIAQQSFSDQLPFKLSILCLSHGVCHPVERPSRSSASVILTLS